MMHCETCGLDVKTREETLTSSPCLAGDCSWVEIGPLEIYSYFPPINWKLFHQNQKGEKK